MHIVDNFVPLLLIIIIVVDAIVGIVVAFIIDFESVVYACAKFFDCCSHPPRFQTTICVACLLCGASLIDLLSRHTRKALSVL
jgi:hypothetical protein